MKSHVIFAVLLAFLPLAPRVFADTAPVDFASGAGIRGDSADGVVTLSVEPALKSYYVGQKIKIRIDVELKGSAEPRRFSVKGLPDTPEISISEFTPVMKNKPDGVASFTADAKLLSAGDVKFNLVVTCSCVEIERHGIFSFQRSKTVILPDVPRVMEIKNVPDKGRPADYSGLVGIFELDGSVSPLKAYLGDILTLSWELRGIGSFDGFVPPCYSPGGSFKTYPPKKAATGSDSVAYTQVFVPAATGIIQASALCFSVFNPLSEKFERLGIGPFDLEITERTENTPEKIVVETSIGSQDNDLTIPHTDIYSLWDVLAKFGRVRGGEARAATSVRSTVYLCPSSESMRLFELPSGSDVEIRERHGAWTRIGFGGFFGWVPDRVLGHAADPAAGK